MAALSKVDRGVLWGSLMSDMSRERAVIPLDKRSLSALSDAVDSALDKAFTSFAETMPEACKTKEGQAMARRLFRDAAKVRAEKGV